MTNTPGIAQGCGPGFWQHQLGPWTAPYDDDDLFSTFLDDDPFPGLTLLQVLELGAGPLNALGRHTVAALLNAANPDVVYEFTGPQIISMFNATYPGASGDYEALKNQFAAGNDSDCPLSGGPGAFRGSWPPTRTRTGYLAA